MYCLSDQQIDFILNDIRRNGIEKADLQSNLLDHICCIIEQELEENGDFEQFYFMIIGRFYKKRLAEIEEETNSLLIFKHYYFMKKIMLLSGAFAACSLTLGIVLKFLHSAGANLAIVSGILVFSLVFLPLMVTLKIKEKTNVRDKVMLFIGSLSAISICLAVLFKLQHWPGANMLGLISVGVLIVVFLPVYFITGIRQPESKINTMVSSVLLVTGCGLFLSLARTPQTSYDIKKQLTQNYLRNELLLQHEHMKEGSLADTTSLHIISLKINELCNQLKITLIESETGNKKLTEDAVLSEDSNNAFSMDKVATNNLVQLKKEVIAYNHELSVKGKDHYFIPSDIPVLNQSNYRTLSTLNELVQIQIFVAQSSHL